jgi:predicted ATP-dependent endonuclease of OLD family
MKRKGKRKRCLCGTIIIPNKKIGTRQKTCGSKDCQRELKRRNNARWRKNNPSYWRDDHVRLKAWQDKNPGYLKEYRKSHPEYVSKGREAQKLRDRSKRLHLDIQDKISKQAPDIIAQLWDKSRSDHPDTQGKMAMKPLEALFLLSLLT